MGVNADYHLTVESYLSDDDFDIMVMRFRKSNSNARHFLNEAGKSSGNEGYWDTLRHDFGTFSQSYPMSTFKIEEKISYDGVTYVRHYFHNGLYKRLEPMMQWPTFESIPYEDAV